MSTFSRVVASVLLIVPALSEPASRSASTARGAPSAPKVPQRKAIGTFTSTIGAGAPPPQAIQLTSSSSQSISFKVINQFRTPDGGNRLQVSPLSGATQGYATIAVDPKGLAEGIYSAFVTFTPSGGSIAQVSVPVTPNVGLATAPVGFVVTSAARFEFGGSPGAIQTIFGMFLADSSESAVSYPLPVALAGTQVLVNGAAAPLYFASPGQINFQMPSGTALGQAQVEVVTSGGRSTVSLPTLITSVLPGLFLTENDRAAALNQDLTPHTSQTPLRAGDIVVLYMTGMGPTTPAVADGTAAPANPLARLDGVVQASVGGLPASVVFAGLTPGIAGLVQANVQIPAGLPPGDVPIFVTVNGVPTNAGSITVK